MEQIRVIVYANENGSREGVYFTEDFETEAGDFIPHGCTLSFDKTLEIDGWDTAFPMDYNLERS